MEIDIEIYTKDNSLIFDNRESKAESEFFNNDLILGNSSKEPCKKTKSLGLELP